MDKDYEKIMNQNINKGKLIADIKDRYHGCLSEVQIAPYKLIDYLENFEPEVVISKTENTTKEQTLLEHFCSVHPNISKDKVLDSLCTSCRYTNAANINNIKECGTDCVSCWNRVKLDNMQLVEIIKEL